MLSFGITHRPPVVLTTRRMSVKMMAKAKGSVKWFDATKGFGFIINEAGGPDLFVHQTAIQASGFRTLADGEAVEFDIEVGSDNKQRAINVTGPNGQNVQGAPRREYFERDERSDYSPRRGGGGGGGYNRRNNDRY